MDEKGLSGWLALRSTGGAHDGVVSTVVSLGLPYLILLAAGPEHEWNA
jgi:hypothetical protein